MSLNEDFSVWKVCVANRRLFAMTAVVAFVASTIVSISIPATYASRARISIDTNDKNPLEKGKGLFSNLKSLFTTSESNVLTEPRVYMKLLESETFYESLGTAKVITAHGFKMSFNNYIATQEKSPWWIVGDENMTDKLKDRVKYEMNTHNFTITIQVELQDAVVACAMVDTVINRLHDYMTAYMVKKATLDYHNRLADRKHAEACYHKAMLQASMFADSNFDVERPEIAMQLKALQNEADRLMKLRNEAAVKAALAKMEVERTRPTFIKLVSNKVPSSPLHPHWIANAVIWLFYSLFLTLMFVLYRKKFQIWRKSRN